MKNTINNLKTNLLRSHNNVPLTLANRRSATHYYQHIEYQDLNEKAQCIEFGVLSRYKSLNDYYVTLELVNENGKPRNSPQFIEVPWLNIDQIIELLIYIRMAWHGLYECAKISQSTRAMSVLVSSTENFNQKYNFTINLLRHKSTWEIVMSVEKGQHLTVNISDIDRMISIFKRCKDHINVERVDRIYDDELLPA